MFLLVQNVKPSGWRKISTSLFRFYLTSSYIFGRRAPSQKSVLKDIHTHPEGSAFVVVAISRFQQNSTVLCDRSRANQLRTHTPTLWSMIAVESLTTRSLMARDSLSPLSSTATVTLVFLEGVIFIWNMHCVMPQSRISKLRDSQGSFRSLFTIAPHPTLKRTKGSWPVCIFKLLLIVIGRTRPPLTPTISLSLVVTSSARAAHKFKEWRSGFGVVKHPSLSTPGVKDTVSTLVVFQTKLLQSPYLRQRQRRHDQKFWILEQGTALNQNRPPYITPPTLNMLMAS